MRRWWFIPWLLAAALVVSGCAAGSSLPKKLPNDAQGLQRAVEKVIESSGKELFTLVTVSDIGVQLTAYDSAEATNSVHVSQDWGDEEPFTLDGEGEVAGTAFVPVSEINVGEIYYTAVEAFPGCTDGVTVQITAAPSGVVISNAFCGVQSGSRQSWVGGQRYGTPDPTTAEANAQFLEIITALETGKMSGMHVTQVSMEAHSSEPGQSGTGGEGCSEWDASWSVGGILAECSPPEVSTPGPYFEISDINRDKFPGNAVDVFRASVENPSMSQGYVVDVSTTKNVMAVMTVLGLTPVDAREYGYDLAGNPLQ